MDDAYEKLLERYQTITDLEQARMVLGWDQQVTMPEGGTPARAQQMSTVSALQHERRTDPELGDLLDAVEANNPDERQRAVVREIRHDYEREAEIPGDLVEEISQTSSEAHEVWQDAREADDFGQFAPTLQRIRDLRVERAEHVDPDANPFAVMHADDEPDISIETVERVFERIKADLVPLIEEIRERGDDPASPFGARGPYDEDEQFDFSQEILETLGFDPDRTRLDRSAHPFTAGNQFDCRITTRFNEDDVVDGLLGTVHEFGHGLYQLGLPDEDYGSPLGEAQSLGVHESQARFWENHVGRTRPFWELVLPRLRERFPQLEDVGVEEAYEAVNRIYPENLIRVEADELTYHLHIILRFEVGRAFVEGDLDVEEIPAAWNDRMEEYLGVRPETDANGCLQDVHWTEGFAAFEAYTIGSVLAAQLDAAMREDLDVDGLVREGEFEPIREWLREHVHRHGRRYPADELIEVATGEPLTADYFVEYATEKYTDLYGL